jgi:hypothetical protein
MRLPIVLSGGINAKAHAQPMWLARVTYVFPPTTKPPPSSGRGFADAGANQCRLAFEQIDEAAFKAGAGGAVDIDGHEIAHDAVRGSHVTERRRSA